MRIALFYNIYTESVCSFILKIIIRRPIIKTFNSFVFICAGPYFKGEWRTMTLFILYTIYENVIIYLFTSSHNCRLLFSQFLYFHEELCACVCFVQGRSARAIKANNNYWICKDNLICFEKNWRLYIYIQHNKKPLAFVRFTPHWWTI